MPGMDNKTDVERKDTTITISRAVRDRLREAKGKGLTWDRWFDELLPPKERTRNERKEEN